MSRQLGLIIGVNQYQDPTFRPLQFAENDARALAQWLVNSKGGNWSPADVQLLQGNHGTYELVQSLISQLFLQMTTTNDLILIYFAGHAFVDDGSGEGYLALANTRSGDPSTTIPLSLLVDSLMARSPASQILVMLDCIQTGQRWNMLRSPDFVPLFGPNILNSLQQQRDRLLLCSCRGNDTLPETGEQSLGMFARRLIIGLCGPAIDPTSANVTLQSLMAFLGNMPSEQQRPQLFGQLQTPFLLTGPSSFNAPQPLQSPPPSSAQVPPGFAPPVAPNPTSGILSAMPQPQYQSTPYATATAQLSPSSPEPRIVPPSGNEELQRQQISQMMGQAQQYFQTQNFAEALNILAAVLRITPQNGGALTLQSQILGTMGRTQEAIASAERLMNLDPANSSSWTLRAVLLSNAGQYEAALSDIERSLELNPNNPETYALKTNIMSRLATTQQNQGEQRSYTAQKKEDPYSFLLGAILQMVSFIVGIAGIALLILRPTLPIYIGLVLASFALAVLIVNAIRGSYRYGIARLLFTLFICLLAGGALGAAYKIGYAPILALLRSRPTSLIPLLFLVIWLALAATLPFILALASFFIGLPARRRSRKAA
jgi:tetratricopeptide (TPR) repeat protein